MTMELFPSSNACLLWPTVVTMETSGKRMPANSTIRPMAANRFRCWSRDTDCLFQVQRAYGANLSNEMNDSAENQFLGSRFQSINFAAVTLFLWNLVIFRYLLKSFELNVIYSKRKFLWMKIKRWKEKYIFLLLFYKSACIYSI